MRALVTGAAGFIGSHVCEGLIAQGIDVVALDCFLPESYSACVKYRNWERLGQFNGIERIEADLRHEVPVKALDQVDVVINEAGMTGLMKSWTDFPLYKGCNIDALANLMRGMVDTGVAHLVQVSTSSVYGRDAVGDESTPITPISPYGVSKLAAEELVDSFSQLTGLEYTILRYFSVYGPRQRPDMAYHRIIQAALTGTPIDVYGDGQQTRSNTYVTDCAAATISAATRRPAGEVMNIAGKERQSLTKAIELIEGSVGRPVTINRHPARPGDQLHTGGDTTRASRVLGYTPTVGLAEGLELQTMWHISQAQSNATIGE